MRRPEAALATLRGVGATSFRGGATTSGSGTVAAAGSAAGAGVAAGWAEAGFGLADGASPLKR